MHLNPVLLFMLSIAWTFDVGYNRKRIWPFTVCSQAVYWLKFPLFHSSLTEQEFLKIKNNESENWG